RVFHAHRYVRAGLQREREWNDAITIFRAIRAGHASFHTVCQRGPGDLVLNAAEGQRELGVRVILPRLQIHQQRIVAAGGNGGRECGGTLVLDVGELAAFPEREPDARASERVIGLDGEGEGGCEFSHRVRREGMGRAVGAGRERVDVDGGAGGELAYDGHHFIGGGHVDRARGRRDAAGRRCAGRGRGDVARHVGEEAPHQLLVVRVDGLQTGISTVVLLETYG